MNVRFVRQSRGIMLDAAFINELMPSANGQFVKVYLYALMCAENNTELSNQQIASALGILESDVVQAFAYWVEAGAIDIADGIVTFRSLTATAMNDTPTANMAQPVLQTPSAVSKPDIGTATDALSSDPALADMCDLAQEVLGKTLTAQDTSTLYWFYDSLGFSPEVILMLLEYCVSKDKRHMNFIEKVALSWHEKGIRTMEQAEMHIMHEFEKGGYINTIRGIMGINDRSFSRTEMDYLYKWRDEYNMSEEMVALAYEYCVIQISKISFQYMDKILSRWNDNNIHTVAAAETDNENFHRTAANPKNNSAQPEVFRDTMNHAELERMVWEKLGK